jgi:hypothetical protein
MLTFSGRDLADIFEFPLPKAGDKLEMICTAATTEMISVRLRVATTADNGSAQSKPIEGPKSVDE